MRRSKVGVGLEVDFEKGSSLIVTSCKLQVTDGTNHSSLTGYGAIKQPLLPVSSQEEATLHLLQALLKVKTEGQGVSRRREGEEEADPLMAMLMCLQEANSYREEQANQSSSDVSAGKYSKSSDSRREEEEED